MLDRDEDSRKQLHRQFHGQARNPKRPALNCPTDWGSNPTNCPVATSATVSCIDKVVKAGVGGSSLLNSRKNPQQSACPLPSRRAAAPTAPSTSSAKPDFPSPRPSAVISGHRDIRLVEQKGSTKRSSSWKGVSGISPIKSSTLRARSSWTPAWRCKHERHERGCGDGVARSALGSLEEVRPRTFPGSRSAVHLNWDPSRKFLSASIPRASRRIRARRT